MPQDGGQSKKCNWVLMNTNKTSSAITMQQKSLIKEKKTTICVQETENALFIYQLWNCIRPCASKDQKKKKKKNSNMSNLLFVVLSCYEHLFILSYDTRRTQNMMTFGTIIGESRATKVSYNINIRNKIAFATFPNCALMKRGGGHFFICTGPLMWLTFNIEQ